MKAPAFWSDPDALAGRLLAPFGALVGAVTLARMCREGARAAVPVVCIGNPTWCTGRHHNGHKAAPAKEIMGVAWSVRPGAAGAAGVAGVDGVVLPLLMKPCAWAPPAMKSESVAAKPNTTFLMRTFS